MFRSRRSSSEPSEGLDCYRRLSMLAKQLLQEIQAAFQADPDNICLEHARNHLSDAYLCLERANLDWDDGMSGLA